MKKTITFLVFLVCQSQVFAQCWSALADDVGLGNASLIIDSDGKLFGFGNNAFNQLGDSSINTVNKPQMINPLDKWKAISTGELHTLAIKSDGTLWAWGKNDFGQLGNNTMVGSKVPIQISNATNWKTVSAGGAFSLALKTDGTIWSWGQGSLGALGHGTTQDKLTPTQIGSGADWKQLSASLECAVALKNNGTLWFWGNNLSGQAGNGTNRTTEFSPKQIGNDNNWKYISTGLGYVLGIKNDGTLWSWGDNSYGQLGNGTTSNVNVVYPTKIGANIDWNTVSAGATTSSAIKNNGSLFIWGDNESCKLGNGAVLAQLTPTKLGADSNWTSSTMYGDYTLALNKLGELCVWGGNQYGQLGNGSNVTQCVPVKITCPLYLGSVDIERRVLDFLLTPNPSFDYLQVLNTNNKKIIQIKILDSMGKVVKKQSSDFTIIDISNLPANLYFIQVESEDNTQTYKVIKR